MTRPARPFWRIVSVFDPEGHCQDFAYTQGLAPRAGCELHLWARPSLGQDAGADWKLSPRNCARLLNRFARQLLAGTLVPMQELEGFDRGQTRLRFTVGEAVRPGEVDAHQLDDHVQVLPLRWSLHRAPSGGLL